MKQPLRLWVLPALLVIGVVALTACQRPKDEVVGRQPTQTTSVAMAGTPQPTEPGTVTIGIETPPAAEATGAPGAEQGGTPPGTPGTETTEPGTVPAAEPTGAGEAPASGAIGTPTGEPGVVTEPATTAEPGATEPAATGGTVSYVVQRGDTLYSIAQRHNTTVEAIRAENNLSSNFIYVGQTLRITPGPGAGTTATPPPSPGETYTVQAGDTLTGIARRYNTTVQAIASANGLTYPYTIYVGQRLTIPGTSTPPSSGTPSSPGRTYVVQPGDTLYSIARRNGTTVEAIRQANGLSSNLIYVGQTLVIP